MEEGVEVLAADWEVAEDCDAAKKAGCGLALAAGEAQQQEQEEGATAGGRWVLYLSRPVSLMGGKGSGRRGSGTGDEESGDEEQQEEGEDEEGYELCADHVWCATGSVVDAGRDPLLAALAAGGCRGDTCGGLPVLTPELRWAGIRAARCGAGVAQWLHVAGVRPACAHARAQVGGASGWKERTGSAMHEGSWCGITVAVRPVNSCGT